MKTEKKETRKKIITIPLPTCLSLPIITIRSEHLQRKQRKKQLPHRLYVKFDPSRSAACTLTPLTTNHSKQNKNREEKKKNATINSIK